MAAQVNSGASSFDGMTLELMNDLDLAGRLWLPIGMNDDAYGVEMSFQGRFNGNGHVIRNMTIDLFMNAPMVGLFGNVSMGTDTGFHDIVIEAARIDCIAPSNCGLLAASIRDDTTTDIPLTDVGSRVSSFRHPTTCP